MRTLQEIENSPKTVLVPADVAPVLGCEAYNINLQAKADPSKLGFPVIMIGSRVKIPKEGFLRFMRGLGGEESA